MNTSHVIRRFQITKDWRESRFQNAPLFGVSGDTSDNDEICAIAGIVAAGLTANPG